MEEAPTKGWIFASDPEEYHWDTLFQKGRDTWDGIKGSLALKNMKMVRPGDPILCYHSGIGKNICAMAKAVSGAYPDPRDPAGKLFAIEIAPVRKLRRAIRLPEIKADPVLSVMPFLKIPRLSIAPLNAKEWKAMEKLEQPVKKK